MWSVPHLVLSRFGASTWSSGLLGKDDFPSQLSSLFKVASTVDGKRELAPKEKKR